MTAFACDECAVAQARPWHVYMAGCSTCTVRWLADIPKLRRDRHLDTIKDESERNETRVAVVAEYHRRKALEVAV